MILDRDKEKESYGSGSQLYLIPLCNKMKKMEIANANSSENANSYENTQIKLKDVKLNNNFENDAIETIDDRLNNIKIEDEEETVISSEKLEESVLDKVETNNESDNKTDDQNIDKNDCNVIFCEDRQFKNNENEKAVDNAKSKEDSDNDKDDNEKEISSLDDVKKEDTTDENSETGDKNKVTRVTKVISRGSNSENSETKDKNKDAHGTGLFPRGPDRHSLITNFQRDDPYNIYNRSLQCGGKTRIAEPPRSQLVDCQQYAHNVAFNYNIINEPETCEPPVQKSSELPEDLSNIDISEAATIFNTYQQEISTVIDIILKDRQEFGPDDDVGLPNSPPSSESSISTECQPQAGSESGVGTDTDCPIVYPKDLGLPKEGNKTQALRDWLTHTAVYPPIPNSSTQSAKSRFQKLLNDKWKLRFWARIQSLSKDALIEGDEPDGDTILMIAVSNKVEGQLELIYALVERMRDFDKCLAAVNRQKHSALYLACILLSEQPLVAAYIAEALVEQGVDVANLKYECGYTLPQILEKEGETHKAVLNELLTVKDGDGKFVFQSYLNYTNSICQTSIDYKSYTESNDCYVEEFKATNEEFINQHIAANTLRYG